LPKSEAGNSGQGSQRIGKYGLPPLVSHPGQDKLAIRLPQYGRYVGLRVRITLKIMELTQDQEMLDVRSFKNPLLVEKPYHNLRTAFHHQ
jgi:hypothetical protein